MPRAEASRTAAQPTPALDTLVERITSGRCHVGIYGLGYVGLPLALNKPGSDENKI